MDEYDLPHKRHEKPYIICSAVWFKDGKKYNSQPRNVDTGIVICGRRHHNCLVGAFELNENSKVVLSKLGEKNTIQGFLTNEDFFVTRQEAGVIAYNAGQTDTLHDYLISEDLY